MKIQNIRRHFGRKDHFLLKSYYLPSLRKSLRLLLVGEAVGLLLDFLPDFLLIWNWQGKKLIETFD